MAQRTSIEDDIGVKSPLSIEVLEPCVRLRIPKKIWIVKTFDHLKDHHNINEPLSL